LVVGENWQGGGQSGQGRLLTLEFYSSYQEEKSRLPFVHMRSETNGNQIRLFIEQKDEQPKPGAFSCYGQNKSTVPQF